jgi:hypothetical protein
MVLHYSNFWREDGHEVVQLFGVRDAVPADVLFMHVDLTVVPDEYIELAGKYPVVINGSVKNIRKSNYTTLAVKASDDYDGKVIVKSDYNYGAMPELSLGLRPPRSSHAEFRFRSPSDYKVYDHLNLVPRVAFDDPSVIVEKFRPELEGGLYHVRVLVFLGNRATCTRLGSKEPIVNGSSRERAEAVEPDPRVLEVARARGFQYGKFDYVMHEGQPLLLDMNKTVGGPPTTTDPQILAGRRHCAEGLYDWFD